MEKKKEVFTVIVKDKEIELAVVRPTQKQKQQSQRQFNLGFVEAVENGAPLRAKIDNIMRDQGIYDEDTEKERTKLIHKISRGERTLKEGGKLLSEGRELALSLRGLRAELTSLTMARTVLDGQTAEAQAEGRRLDYLISSCLVYNDGGKPYFEDLEDYINRADDSDVASEGARRLALMLYGLDEDFEKSLPENSFLLDYGFVNEKLRLINKKGQMVDVAGKLINEEGRFIDEKGDFVNTDGLPVTEEGDPIVDFKPFIDDETGNEVKLDTDEPPAVEEEREVAESASAE